MPDPQKVSILISNNLDGNTAGGSALGASVSCDQAQNMESAESRGLILKEIATKVSRWLQLNNVLQKYFAEKALNQSQGSLTVI